MRAAEHAPACRRSQVDIMRLHKITDDCGGPASNRLNRFRDYFGKTWVKVCNFGSSPGAVGALAVISAIAVMP